jgi:sulfate adenylyltransferase
VFRQNYGCSRMIIGRDHAGVGDFYGMFEAQTIFDKIPYVKEACPAPGKALLCRPLKIDWTFYCFKCDGMASLRTCPHTKKDRVILSGTMLRKLLSEGGEVPDHFGREEVLVVLREYYEGLTDKVEIKLHGAATGDAT